MRPPIRALAAAAWLLVLTAIASPEASAVGSEAADRRLAYETARLAIESGEPRLAAGLLDELAAAAPRGPEEALYRAVAASVGGDAGALAGTVEEAWKAAQNTGGTIDGWVGEEILSLVAKLRLDELRRERARRLEAVLAEHRRALGGLDAGDRLGAFAAAGTVSRGEGRTPFRLVRARPGFYRLDLATPAGVWTQVADLQAAWRADPGVEDGRARYLDGDEAAAARRAAAFDGPLVRPLAAGERLLYQGAEVFGGRDGHLVERLDAEGSRLESVWLDGETFLEARRRVYGPDGELVSEVTTEHRRVEGHPLPGRQTVRGTSGTLVFEFESYRLDPPLPDSLFDFAENSRVRR